MYLKSLEITGFKSFAKKTELKFNTPISAIVGPNGSGKSNVAEAFRFVLGEQSIKSMRGKNREDLIFNGTNFSSRLNRANVKIVFDNQSKFLDIDYDEVSIERVVHRDGTNQYFINKSLVRLKDITELLAGANIGSSGHHIISQGEADKILNVNPWERQTMVEESLGLKIYQYKRIASEKKLEKVEENIEAVQSLRRENAPHLRFLKKQVEKVEKSLELRKELKQLYLAYFKRENNYLKYWKKQIDDEKRPLLAQKQTLEKKLSQAQATLKEDNSSNNDNQKILGLEGKLNDVRSHKDALNLKLGRTEGMVTALEMSQAQASTQSTERNFSLQEVKTLEDKINSQIEIAETLEDTQQIKGILKRIKESLVQFISKSLEKNNSEEGDRLDENKNTKLAELVSEKEKIVKELDRVREEEQTILSQYNKLKLEIENNQHANRKAELTVFEIKAQQSELQAKLNSLQNKENQINIDDGEYKQELNEAYILVGRDSIQFQDFAIKNEQGDILTQTDFVNEERQKQTERRKKIEKIKIKVEDLGGGSGEDILKEYEEAQKRDDFLNGEIEDLEKSAEALKTLIAELKEKIEIKFEEGLKKINIQFKEFFNLMFGGGRAELRIVKQLEKKTKQEDSLNINDEELVKEVEEEEENQKSGIEVDVSLPNKKIKGLQMLSGGERSLTSIALLFAMSQVTPPPFIILDETDAALDEANSKKYGDMIETLAKSSQLILITHNRETMARAQVLYGVTMGSEGISKLLSVQFDEAVQVAK